MVKVDGNLFKKDKKFRKFYDDIYNDIKALRNKEMDRNDQEEKFIKELVIREDEEEKDSISNQHLTIEERLALLQLKNNTLRHLSKMNEDKENLNYKLQSSLAFTEDEIEDRIASAKMKLLEFFSDHPSPISTTSITSHFHTFTSNPYLKKPFKNLLSSIADEDPSEEWRLKAPKESE
jgi:hypothetical protein